MGLARVLGSHEGRGGKDAGTDSVAVEALGAGCRVQISQTPWVVSDH